MRIIWLTLLFLLVAPAAAQDDRGALVTALEGKAYRIKGTEKKPVEVFERLDAGELLALEEARLTLVFFATGRQEVHWGNGRLEIGPGEGRSPDLAAPEVKQLPAFMVRQIGRTPLLVAQGRAGVTRLRAIPTPDAIARIDETYKRLRMEAAAGDLNPDLYRLSALFEIKAYDAVGSALRDLELSRPGHGEARLLITLYRKALRNVQGGS